MEAGVWWSGERLCITYFSRTVIKYHDQGKKKGFILDIRFQEGEESVTVTAGKRGGWSNSWELISQATSRKQRTNWRYHGSFVTLQPPLCDSHLPARPCLPIFKQSLAVAQSLKCLRLVGDISFRPKQVTTTMTMMTTMTTNSRVWALGLCG